MAFTFDICELYIYFGFMKSELTNKDNHEIYKKYINNICKNNKIVRKYIFDITNSSYSDVTFDSGFDVFNLTDQNILGKQTQLIDFNINSCMKLKKYALYNQYDNINNSIQCCDFNENLDLDNYISYLTSNIGFNLTKNLETFCGYYLYPRSSMGLKTPLRCANSVGIIDSGYRGSIKGCLTNINDTGFNLSIGERYMQICPGNITLPIYITEVSSLEKLGKTERGNGGFGSTGI